MLLLLVLLLCHFGCCLVENAERECVCVYEEENVYERECVYETERERMCVKEREESKLFSHFPFRLKLPSTKTGKHLFTLKLLQ